MYNSIGQLCHSSYYTFRRMHEQSIYDLRHKFMINIGHMHINMICYVCPTHWCTKIRVAINLDYVSNIANVYMSVTDVGVVSILDCACSVYYC